jgi:hypothetical protein
MNIENLYIIKNEKDYFLLSLMNSGILESLNPYLVYKKDELIHIEFTICDVKNAVDFFNDANKLFNKYDTILKLLWCLQKQQNALSKLGYSFYNLDLKNILVFDSSIFVLMNTDFIREMREDQCIFFSPLIKNDFSSLEVNQVSSLPNKVSTHCFIYSLGLLCFFLFTGKKYEKEMNLKIELSQIYNTKMYWMILRCLNERKLIYL